MSRAIAVLHGRFGRACLYEMNRSMATHAHREGHLIFYLQGQAPRIEVSGRACPLDGNTAIAVSPLQPHDITFKDNQSDSLLLVLYINPLWFLEVGRSSEGTLRFGTNSIQVTTQVHRLVQYVTNLLVDGDHQDLFDGYLYELTQECYDQSRQWVAESSNGLQTWQGVRDHRVRKAIRLMKDRISDELALDQIASESGLSRPHFYKLFRENVGITPNVYLNTLRMELAIDRLITTDEAVTSIGLDLGFASQASFTRFFGAHVGIPPTNYRRVAHCA